MRPFVLLSLALLPAPVLADSAPLPLSYQMFEAAVLHVDLELCPADLAGEGRFCRAAMLHDEIHVFAFSEEGDQPMVGFRSWPVDRIAAQLN